MIQMARIGKMVEEGVTTSVICGPPNGTAAGVEVNTSLRRTLGTYNRGFF